MSEILEYIDAYFNQELGNSERQEFEARCSTDENFAKEVAFYMMARQTAREALLEQKQKQWQTGREEKETIVMKPVKKKSVVLRFVSYAAAACVVFIIGGYFLFYQPTPQRLANRYIDNITWSQTMDGSHDSIQSGIAAFKNHDYKQAVLFFNGAKQADPANSDAKKYEGLSYIQLKDYDKALQSFKELSAMKGLYINSGDILQAVTLLKRDKPGDKEEAKQLLEKVVREHEEGSEKANEMLENW